MPDIFASLGDAPSLPSRAPFAIVPDNVAALATVPKAIYVGTGGTVILRGVDATADVTYKNVASGTYLQVRAAYVRATGTTAADMIGEA